MLLPFAPIFLGSQLLSTAADGVPTIDIHKTCRAAAVVTAGTSPETDIEICVSSEEKAREQLVNDWSKYAVADKARCIQAGSRVYLPSYIEWLTCVEMETAVKNMRQEQKVGPTGAIQRGR
jgi:hypothetical protein